MLMPRVWEMNEKWAAQRTQCGRVKAKLGRKTKVCSLAAFVKAICLTMRCTYGPGDKISLFLQDLELAKVALSCLVALDMLCQEMNGPW